MLSRLRALSELSLTLRSRVFSAAAAAAATTTRAYYQCKTAVKREENRCDEARYDPE